MRLLFWLVALAMFIPGAAFAQDAAEDSGDATEEDYPVCYISGERWDTSSTRLEVIFRLDGQLARGRFLNLAYMLMAIELFNDEGRAVETMQIDMLDYATFGTESEQLIRVNDTGSNILLVFTDQKLEGSAAPYMAAFSTKEDAEGLRKQIDTSADILSWDKALDHLVAALLADEEEEDLGMQLL